MSDERESPETPENLEETTEPALHDDSPTQELDDEQLDGVAGGTARAEYIKNRILATNYDPGQIGLGGSPLKSG